MKRVFIFAFLLLFFLLSCTHWLIDTQTRIQVKNSTGERISDLSIVSKNGQKIVLVPGSIENDKESKVYEIEWVGEFNFVVRLEENWDSLGVHKLKGGTVLATIGKNGDKLTMELK